MMNRFTINAFSLIKTIFWSSFVFCQAQLPLNTVPAQHQFKGYSGLRWFNDSLRMVYFHELTVAVVELGDGTKLLNCELIEVYSDKERDDFLKILQKNVGKLFKLSFNEMVDLTAQCENFDSTRHGTSLGLVIDTESSSSGSYNTILRGIMPGTKWCGTGDVARNYFDLGTERDIDKCCRRHDLCPVKVASNGSRYNLSNKSAYTKSHCVCDDNLARCLKNVRKSNADLVGNLYFNIIRIPCINDGKDGKKYRSAKTY